MGASTVRYGHLFVAVISAIGGAIALTFTWFSGDWWSPGALLGVVLLLNAVVRIGLARH
jgi:hypothetical protein